VSAYPEPVKEFWVYTALRVLLFLASLAIVLGVWVLIAGEFNLFFAVIIAFVLSGIGSYFVLDAQREAFARRVQTRAEKASSKLEEMRSKEDAD
jgi:ABC-type bacteriocin/lantibiotic exporter with double-glycine peptidase domain